MTGDIDEWVGEIHTGDSATVLSNLPTSSVHTCVTSPPYYNLRDYGVEGQIGLEDSLDEYIQELVTVGEELRRVLRDDGCWWLNIGDTYADKNHTNTGKKEFAEGDETSHIPPSSFVGKDKMMVPHRVAIALQNAGWVVRSDAVWKKQNPMPHSVDDRLNETKEFLFHLTPSQDYWFNLDAIREPHKESSIDRVTQNDGNPEWDGDDMRGHPEGNVETLKPEQFLHAAGKNPGDVFEIKTELFPKAHFAVMPTELAEKPIKATCPPTVCAGCGTPYEAILESDPIWEKSPSEAGRPQLKRAIKKANEAGLTAEHFEAIQAVGIQDTDRAAEIYTGAGNNAEEVERLAAEAKSALGSYFREFVGDQESREGWQQACDCDTSETKSGIVIDPFNGVGTTPLKAKDLGRQFIGIDLNEEYCDIARERLGMDIKDPTHLREDDQQGIEAFQDTHS